MWDQLQYKILFYWLWILVVQVLVLYIVEIMMDKVLGFSEMLTGRRDT
jgi:hypothetical protein